MPGIHHVTMIASDAQAIADFYGHPDHLPADTPPHIGRLGLRMVKRTVNFDDPGTYHFYFADAAGSPGTVLTHFPHAGLPRGRAGLRQTVAIRLWVAPGSLDAWEAEASSRGETEFGEQILTLHDPDGLRIDLVEWPDATVAPGTSPWVGRDGTTAVIYGVHSVVLDVEGYERTADVLVQHLSFRDAGRSGNVFRFRSNEGDGPAVGALVDVRCRPGATRGLQGAGTVHHVAFRAKDDADQSRIRFGLVKAGFNVTPVLDRHYFHSIYFREPGGVLFEVATDPPGFAVDEAPESLGAALKLASLSPDEQAYVRRLLPPVNLVGATD